MRADPTREQSETLKTKHQLAIHRGNNWLGVWDMFVNDPWYQGCLEKAVGQTIRFNHMFAELADDIAQEANILFGVCVRRRTDLGFDSERGAYHSFLQKIIFRCCSKASANVKRRSKTGSEKVRETAIEIESSIDRLDLSELIESLPDQQRLVLNLYCNGNDNKAIATTIGKTERTVYRILDAGILELQRLTKTKPSTQKTRSHWR